MAAVVLEDFVKPFCKEPFSQKAADLLMKISVVVSGIVCVVLVFVVEKSGSHVLQVITVVENKLLLLYLL